MVTLHPMHDPTILVKKALSRPHNLTAISVVPDMIDGAL